MIIAFQDRVKAPLRYGSCLPNEETTGHQRAFAMHYFPSCPVEEYQTNGDSALQHGVSCDRTACGFVGCHYNKYKDVNRKQIYIYIQRPQSAPTRNVSIVYKLPSQHRAEL